ncbi:hypothetical protein CIB48_g11467 [Xylaria polymorpha]|nr:hypothetical protein CIB48_g11467 [Xylaria polymorpha]
MSASATLPTSGSESTNSTDAQSSINSSRSVRQRCQQYLKRGKASAKRRLHPLKRLAKIGSHTSHHLDDPSIKKREPIATSGGIASDLATVPDFSDWDDVELGDHGCCTGCCDGLGAVLKGVFICLCCLFDGLFCPVLMIASMAQG